MPVAGIGPPGRSDDRSMTAYLASEVSSFFYSEEERMLEIKGKVNTAICYASVVEDQAIEQIRRMCDYEFTAGSRIRIMPDVHAGKGCTIGTTMTVTDKAVPNIVGVDIGCGMYTVSLGKADIDFEKLDEAAHFIPSGMRVWDESIEHFDLLTVFCEVPNCLAFLKGTFHLHGHSLGANHTEHPQFSALIEKHPPKQQGQLPLFRIVVIKELWIQKI